eukprot:1506599-Rhodomonas_salina.1
MPVGASGSRHSRSPYAYAPTCSNLALPVLTCAYLRTDPVIPARVGQYWDTRRVLRATAVLTYAYGATRLAHPARHRRYVPTLCSYAMLLHRPYPLPFTMPLFRRYSPLPYPALSSDTAHTHYYPTP